MSGRKEDDAAASRQISRGHLKSGRPGQTAVEFAAIAVLAMIVLFVSIQLALIGEAKLALGQMNYQGVRFASDNPCADSDQIASYMCAVGSPTITKGNGANLAITVNGTSGSPGDCSVPNVNNSCPSPARYFGSNVTVGVSFNMTGSNGVLFLRNLFFGLKFPTTLSSTESAMTE
jgi:Flp pilus assembly protein TadG